jgi:hypothetical protein
MATNKASQASGYMKKISSLEEKVSSVMAKVVHSEECESFILGIVESACEMLRCEFSFDSSFPYLCTAVFVTFFAVVGSCLDFAAEERRVASEMRLWRKFRLAVRLCGLILDVGVPLCCFKTVPSILASQLMVADELSQLCTPLCFLVILCLQLSHFFLILSDPAIVFIG